MSSVLKTCLVCGVEFIARRKDKKYCSAKCHQKEYRHSEKCKAYHREYEKSEKRKAYRKLQASVAISKAIKEERACCVCGKSFISRTKSSKVCSRSCRYKLKKNKNGQRIYFSNCLKCGKLYSSVFKNKKYCSKSCYHESDEYKLNMINLKNKKEYKEKAKKRQSENYVNIRYGDNQVFYNINTVSNEIKPLINALLTIRKKKILYKGVLQHEFNETK
jgi:predicted nucleic acid-binding Zn ribbon protein